eukprot:s57_g16.t1
MEEAYEKLGRDLFNSAGHWAEDFLVHTEEYYGVGSVTEVDLTVPVLVQAQPERCRGILMPWWAFLQWDWTRRYRERLEQASREIQWEDRAEDTVHRDCQEVYDASGLRVAEIVPPEAHVLHKYLAYLDGTSFSDRLFWLLLTDSLVFRAGSSIRVWLDAGLEAWKHYDLLDQLDWAKQHDEDSARIAAEAARFAKSDLTLEASLFYLYQLLLRLSKVIRLTPEEIRATPEKTSNPFVALPTGT